MVDDSGSADRSLGDYYNASQLRADTWNRLKSYADRLTRIERGSERHSEIRRKAVEALEILTPVESYWAFPGHEAFGRLGDLLNREDYGHLARSVARLVIEPGNLRTKTPPFLNSSASATHRAGIKTSGE